MAHETWRTDITPFVRASVGHIGAAAATASLRHDLVERGSFDPGEFDTAYAVARITPGTNLLALYYLLGHRLGGWRTAFSALAIWFSIKYVQQSYVIDEQSADPGGLAHRWILKAMIPAGFVLFGLQSVAEIAKQVVQARKARP